MIRYYIFFIIKSKSLNIDIHLKQMIENLNKQVFFISMFLFLFLTPIK